MNFNVKM